MKIQLQGAVRVEVSEFFRPAIVPGDDVPELQLLVGGKWRTAAKGDVFDVRSPIDGRVISRAAKASADDVEEAIAAARQARGDFRATPAATRLEICARAASVLAEQGDWMDDSVGKSAVSCESRSERWPPAAKRRRTIAGPFWSPRWNPVPSTAHREGNPGNGLVSGESKPCLLQERCRDVVSARS